MKLFRKEKSVSYRPPLLRLQCVQGSPGGLADSAGPGRGLRLCISDDLLHGAEAAGPWPRLGGR